MLIFGVVFFAIPFARKGMSTGSSVLLLLGYLVVAGFYLGTAYKQYREKRQA